MDDIDRILASEAPLVPSSRFASRVMEAVGDAAVAPPPLPFPWRRFALGLAASAVGIVTGAVLVASPGWEGPAALASALAPIAPELEYAGVVVAGTLAAWRVQRSLLDRDLRAEG